MNERPSTLLIKTYQFAIGLKFIGAAVALGLSFVLVEQWNLTGWGMALVTPIILYLLTLPWPGVNQNKLLIAALAFGILAPHIDLTYGVLIRREDLFQDPSFLAIGWSLQDVNRIHSMGQIFVIVPVILASWQFGMRGFLGGLVLAGIAYVGTPFLLNPDSFIWGIYAIRGFVLLGVTLIVGFITGTLAADQRRSNEALQAANEQLAAQAVKMEQLATSQERNRLARELHDTLAHSLSGTAVSLQAIGTLLKHDPTAAKAELTAAQTQIRSGLAEARRAITALRAAPLEELGLKGAILQRAESIRDRAGIQIDCSLVELPSLSPESEQTLYRICEEALVNAEKHAQCSYITLKLAQTSGEITLTVQDNGLGFDATRPMSNGRFGIIGMHERAALVNGRLTITSQPGKGTAVVFKLIS